MILCFLIKQLPVVGAVFLGAATILQSSAYSLYLPGPFTLSLSFVLFFVVIVYCVHVDWWLQERYSIFVKYRPPAHVLIFKICHKESSGGRIKSQDKRTMSEASTSIHVGTVSTDRAFDQTSEPQKRKHTSSINRGYSDLDFPRFIALATFFCWLRIALQQPLHLALARKQTSSAASAMSALEILRRIYRCEGGLRGLTQGMAALTLECSLGEAIYLSLFEYCREKLPVESTTSRTAISGFISDATCRLVQLPISIVALRQMTERNINADGTPLRKNMFRTMREMYREGGMRTVYAGYGSTVLVGSQRKAVWWTLYGWSKIQLYDAADGFLVYTGDNENLSSSSWWCWLFAKDDNFVLNTVASIFTGSCVAALFNPYFVLRANLQVTPNGRLWSVGRDLYRTRGVRGFYGGLAVNITTSLLDGILASISYEYAKLWADKTIYP